MIAITPLDDAIVVTVLFITRLLVKPSKIEMEYLARVLVFFVSISLTFFKRWTSSEHHPHIDRIILELKNIIKKKKKIG